VVGIGAGLLQTSMKNRGSISPLDTIVRTIQSPVASLSSSIATGTNGFFVGALSGDKLLLENARLKRQLSALAMYSETVSRYENEVNQLRVLNGLGETYKRPKVIADITGYFPMSHSLKVGAGSNKGVAEGMPVLSAEGLVGRVQAVGSRECQVVLTTSSAFKIGGVATNHTPQVAGLIGGDNSSVVTMTVQAIDSPLASGDLIFTTGFSPLIPRGIPIGRVISVENLQEIGATRARVLPIANVGSLREVVIIR